MSGRETFQAADAQAAPRGVRSDGAPHPAEAQDDRVVPHAPRFGRKRGITARRGAAISSHPLVTQTALQVLDAGGNAADAVLAAALAQTVIEPHMTTITGMFSARALAMAHTSTRSVSIPLP